MCLIRRYNGLYRSEHCKAHKISPIRVLLFADSIVAPWRWTVSLLLWVAMCSSIRNDGSVTLFQKVIQGMNWRMASWERGVMSAGILASRWVNSPWNWSSWCHLVCQEMATFPRSVVWCKSDLILPVYSFFLVASSEKRRHCQMHWPSFIECLTWNENACLLTLSMITMDIDSWLSKFCSSFRRAVACLVSFGWTTLFVAFPLSPISIQLRCACILASIFPGDSFALPDPLFVLPWGSQSPSESFPLSVNTEPSAPLTEMTAISNAKAKQTNIRHASWRQQIVQHFSLGLCGLCKGLHCLKNSPLFALDFIGAGYFPPLQTISYQQLPPKNLHLHRPNLLPSNILTPSRSLYHSQHSQWYRHSGYCPHSVKLTVAKTVDEFLL